MDPSEFIDLFSIYFFIILFYFTIFINGFINYILLSCDHNKIMPVEQS